MTIYRLIKLLAPATVIVSSLLTIAVDASADEQCRKTTTFETDSNGNTVIRIKTVCVKEEK
jgi:hypothetical protein